MSEQMIIEQCSPTLAGLKTASLFSYRYQGEKSLREEIRRFNRALSHKGIRMLPVRVEKDFALIYLYRPKKLESDIGDRMCAEILRTHGYSCISANRCLAELMHRFKVCQEFPHEIGLFLGYPPEDVKSFIEHKNDGCKCVGYCKVYGDEEYAKRCFAQYKKCTRLYKEQYAKGKSMERLTVAIA